MALEMRAQCERCNAPLPPEGEAFICSYECTFYPSCSAAMDRICPNCGGEQVSRPRRRPRASFSTAVEYVRKALDARAAHIATTTPCSR